jgi:putative DNA primase/helicase
MQDTHIANDPVGQPRLIHVTFFKDQHAFTLQTREMEFADLQDLILHTTGINKEVLPWLKMARFGPNRSDKDCLRTNANTEAISGIELDYDAMQMSVAEASEILEDAHLTAILYTTASHTAAAPKWRLLLPTSQDLPPDERAQLVARVNGLFGGIFASESFVLSQAYQYGSVNKNPDHSVHYFTGDYIDWRDDLDATAIGKTHNAVDGGNGFDGPIDVQQRLDAMAYKGKDDTSVHNTQLAVSASLLNKGHSLDEVVGILLSATLEKFAHTIGRNWDWQKEARDIREMCETWIAKRQASAKEDEQIIKPMLDKFDNSQQKQTSDERAPAFSDEALALTFAATHQGDLRYVATWGKWMRWTGMHWRSDDALFAFDKARVTCRQTAAKANTNQKTLASAKTVAAVVTLARADRRLSANSNQWDVDPFLLNTPDGVIDLRTGEIRSHQVDGYMTKLTAIAPDHNCDISLWKNFLIQIMDGNGSMIRFLQRVAGYALTGVTHEDALFFFWGTGANGKSVLLNTVANILHDYHKTAAVETFMSTKNEQHPTDLAGLRGARLVIASEVEEGRRWNESRIKTLTGGDPVSARFMRQDFFEYVPQYKIIVPGNHKPTFRNINPAIQRRVNLVPFLVTIPVEQRDKHLSKKLKAEWPGILHWMIEGCLAWQQRGLDAPEIVLDATADYFEEEDPIGRWIGDCCMVDQNAFETSDVVFQCWCWWADQAKETIGSQKRLIGELRDRGFRPDRYREQRGVWGLKIINPPWLVRVDD